MLSRQIRVCVECQLYEAYEYVTIGSASGVKYGIRESALFNVSH